ncbi:MAG: hypothetical protein JW818_02150 [Pirellulales bacterium]|nr:hypothetical protein [Pirellulales bacterium]
MRGHVMSSEVGRDVTQSRVPGTNHETATGEGDGLGHGGEPAGVPLWAIELGCWTIVVLTPLFYWLNGPAASTDQLVVRSGLVGFALGGGLALRLAAWSRGAERDETES